MTYDAEYHSKYRQANRKRLADKQRKYRQDNRNKMPDRNHRYCSPSKDTIDMCAHIMELCGLKGRMA